MDSQTTSLLFFTVYLAFTPIVFWLWLQFYKNKSGKFPFSLMITLVLLGAASVVPAGLIEYAAFTYLIPQDIQNCFFATCQLTESVLFNNLWISFGIVAIAEELSKLVLLGLIIRNSSRVTRMFDAVQYGALFGMGFAGLENALYLYQSFTQLEFNQLFTIFSIRFLISSVGHALYGAAMGYFIFKAKLNPLKRWKFFTLALVVPWLTHATFNFFLIINVGYYTVLIVSLALALLIWTLSDPRVRETVRIDRKANSVNYYPSYDYIVTINNSIKEKDNLYTCPLCKTKNIFDNQFCSQCGYELHPDKQQS